MALKSAKSAPGELPEQPPLNDEEQNTNLAKDRRLQPLEPWGMKERVATAPISRQLRPCDTGPPMGKKSSPGAEVVAGASSLTAPSRGYGKGGKSGKSMGGAQSDFKSPGLAAAKSPQPAVGPGQGLRRSDLRTRWQRMKPQKIVDFYGHRWASMGEWAVFSNFYDQSETPFDFRVPLAFCACDLMESERVVRCEFSEKAIMLCKAAAMGDDVTYRKIVKAKTPEIAKKLGRQVAGFKEDVWQQIECSVAFHVVHRKFATTPWMQKILLRYDGLYAEMTANDVNWGTGINRGDANAQDPSRWIGTNMLGWALQEAREALIAGQDAEHFDRALAKQAETISETLDNGKKVVDSEFTRGNGEHVANAEDLTQAARSIFKYVTGVLNGAEGFEEDAIASKLRKEELALWSSAEPSFFAACDALAAAIDASFVPPQGLKTLEGLAERLARHGVTDAEKLPLAIAARGDGSEVKDPKGGRCTGGKKRWARNVA